MDNLGEAKWLVGIYTGLREKYPCQFTKVLERHKPKVKNSAYANRPIHLEDSSVSLQPNVSDVSSSGHKTLWEQETLSRVPLVWTYYVYPLTLFPNQMLGDKGSLPAMPDLCRTSPIFTYVRPAKPAVPFRQLKQISDSFRKPNNSGACFAGYL